MSQQELPSAQPQVAKEEEAPKKTIDVKLLDQQLADLDSDEFDSDDDIHSGGCDCCAGLVATIH